MSEFFFPKGQDPVRSSPFGEQTSSVKECALQDLWQFLLANENMIQIFALCACTVLVAYMLTEFLGLESSSKQSPLSRTPMFGYSVFNGPHTWKELFPAARGKRQSPVNIITQDVVLVKSVSCLCWKNYSCTPIHLSLTNNGMGVILQGKWPKGPPSIQGSRGAVEGVYEFQAAFFRWGMSDNEGSEHTINFMAYPMELQVLHANTNPPPPPCPSLLMVAYLFELTDVDNPYLDQVIMSLYDIVYPGKCVDVQPFPLMWLAPPFQDQYFAYDGSLTFPPCCENVRWIVRPVSIGISMRQTEQFRQLLGWDGPLRSNLRPVQCINGREIYFYPPSSPCYCETEANACTSSSCR